MHVIRDLASIHQLTDPFLTNLLDQRSEALLADFPDLELQELVTIIVLEPHDALEELSQYLGFYVLTNRHDESRFGESTFTPSFELIAEHPAYFEIVFVLSDDGFGLEVFVPKTTLADPQLLAMCTEYATPSVEASPP